LEFSNDRIGGLSSALIRNRNTPSAMNGVPTVSREFLDLSSKQSSKLPVAFQNEACHYSCRKSKGGILDERKAMKDKPDVLQGTLALMVLKTLDVLGPQHGYGIARRVEQISGDLLAVNQGTLYPLLLKLENEGSIASEWGASENNRRARFYRLTKAGRKQLQAETRDWEQTAAIIARFFNVKAGDLA
jgi:PadR family transcriptional regulator, regulatory protein PadR